MGEFLLVRGDARRIALPSKSVDLVIGSPPYVDARLYLEVGRNIGISRGCLEWVEWMLEVTAEAVRVSRGLVLWVCAGVTRDHCYWPACEGLLWEWWKRGGHCWRPCYWHRVGIPGSGGRKWLRADVEYVLAFKGPGNDFWTDNLATGKPPKFGPGGRMSHRTQDGKRIVENNGNRRPSGKQREHCRITAHPDVCNPGNIHPWEFSEIESEWLDTSYIHTYVGGGHLGSDIAHESEAPYPESLVEFFVKSFCPDGGTALDPFSGSGTTAAVGLRLGRDAIGIDIRRSQAELGARRIADSLRPVSKYDPKPAPRPLPGQGSLF